MIETLRIQKYSSFVYLFAIKSLSLSLLRFFLPGGGGADLFNAMIEFQPNQLTIGEKLKIEACMRSLHHKLVLRFIYLSQVVLIPAYLGSSILRIISWSPLLSKEVSLSGQICQRRYTLSVTHIWFNENKVIFYAKGIWKLRHSFNRGIYIILYMISCCFSKFLYYVVFFWILHSSI